MAANNRAGAIRAVEADQTENADAAVNGDAVSMDATPAAEPLRAEARAAAPAQQASPAPKKKSKVLYVILLALLGAGGWYLSLIHI